MPKLPQLDLNNYTLHSLSFEPRTDFDSERDVKTQVEVGFRVDGKPDSRREFAVLLAVRLHTDGLTAANLPYDVTARIVGFFASARDITGPDVDPQLVTNALTILYGIARGHVAQTTSLGFYGKLVLPAVSFVDLVEKAPSGEKASASPRQRVSKKKPAKVR